MREWWADKGANQDILDQPRFREGLASLPEPERGVLVQSQGRTWRHIHTVTVFYGGALYIFGVSLLIALFLAVRGRISIAEGESSETVERFSALERANHCSAQFPDDGVDRPRDPLRQLRDQAVAGLVVVRRARGASAWSHMTFAVPFVLGVLVMIALWTRQNLWERLDWQWLKRGGGFLRTDGKNPPARKFNAGQKLVFWSVVLGGLSLTVTGAGMMFPFL